MDNDLYSGAATIGRLWAWGGAIISTVIGLVMIGFGIYFLLNPTKSTIGTALAASTPYGKDKNNLILYTTPIAWNVVVNGVSQRYSGTLSGSIPYQINQHMTVYYEISDPSKGSLGSSKFEGWTLIAVGIITPLLAWIWLWIVDESKFIAAASGTYDVFKMLR